MGSWQLSRKCQSQQPPNIPAATVYPRLTSFVSAANRRSTHCKQEAGNPCLLANQLFPLKESMKMPMRPCQTHYKGKPREATSSVYQMKSQSYVGMFLNEGLLFLEFGVPLQPQPSLGFSLRVCWFLWMQEPHFSLASWFDPSLQIPNPSTRTVSPFNSLRTSCLSKPWRTALQTLSANSFV